MERQHHKLPTTDEIQSRLIDELHRHRTRVCDEDIISYVESERLLQAVAHLAHANLDPKLSNRLERRTKDVLRRMERKGLVLHWVSENWYLTDVGMRSR